MQLIRSGDRGDAVQDVQRRLGALGYTLPPEERHGLFGPLTDQAVRAFQQKRGLVVDGIVGVDTWRELVEASWRLGDRVLYLRAPHLRGDDVRDLQDRLATLGFDVGRVDGIFGPRTQRAVREFQRNYGLPEDGIVAVDSVRALAGLPTIAGDRSASVIREREAVRARAAAFPGIRVVLDPAHGPDEPGNVGPSGAREADVCFELARRIEAALAAAGAQVFLTRRHDSHPTDSERAGLANALDADVVVSLHLGGGEARAHGAAAYFFGHERFRSETGERLAEILLEHVCALGLLDARAHAKTFPILRETRMTAVVLEPAYITNPDEERLITDPSFQGKVAASVVEALQAFVAQPTAV